MSTNPSPSNVGPQRGEVWIVNFNPTKGQEVRKKRRAVVLSVPEVGKLALRVVVPLTGWNNKFASAPWMTKIAPSPINGITKDVCADGFQVKSISLERFVEKKGQLPASLMREIAAAVALVIGYE